jgi:hypothetical protein
MQGVDHCRDVTLHVLRPVARATAYAIVFLLAAVWLTSAMASFLQPLFDLDKPFVGDAIARLGGVLHLSPQGLFELAHMLVSLKLLLGTYLLTVVIFAAYERLRWRRSSDDMLDIALLVSAIGSIIASGPLVIEGEGVRPFVGELMLCVIASGLTLFARDLPSSEAATQVATAAAPVSAEPVAPDPVDGRHQAA